VAVRLPLGVPEGLALLEAVPDGVPLPERVPLTVGVPEGLAPADRDGVGVSVDVRDEEGPAEAERRAAINKKKRI